jgi:8-oxo-dGTP pyrophosphatase MutT (NUDIX family)
MTKILKEQTILSEENAIEVRKVDLEFPNGRKASHYIVERVPVSVVFPITAHNQIYLIYQYRYLLGKKILEAVSGRIEKGESALKTARRELLEEAGISAGSFEELSKIELASSFFRAKVSLFLARDLEVGKQELEDSEEIEVVRMPISEAIKKVMSGEIQSASTIAGILMIDRLKKEGKL